MLQLFVTLSTIVSGRLDTDRERGATAVEYGLIVALIAAIIVGVVGFLGADVLDAFTKVESGIDGKAGG